jgi:hypothetical protein
MTPQRPLRRLLAVFACTVGLLIPQVSSADARPPAVAGDLGSGPALRLAPVPSATNGVKWSDVPKSHWARTAIDYVGATYEWMRDFGAESDGAYPFKPDEPEARKLFARSVVLAFAPDETVDPAVTFVDLPESDRFFPYANIAVKLGWISGDASGNFLPDDPVTVRTVHEALVPAMGLGDLAIGVDALHMRNGTKISTPPGFGALLIGMRAGLRYNHSDESLDVGPDTALPRAEVAWSLYRAKTADSWVASYLAPYADIELPNLSPAMQRVVDFGARFVGYPYVYGGEWFEPTPEGYCCGAQPVGGFDCSGISWWVMKAANGGWDNVPPRDYQGWELPQRSSAEMAASGKKVRKFDDLRPGDLVFYDGDSNGTVDHVDVYIGGGWSIDSSSSMGGVSIVRIDSGWYRDHFVRGRRIL